MTKWLTRILSSERGEVPDTTQDPEKSPDTTPIEPEPEPAPDPEPDKAAEAEQFLDPASIPEELKPHWKRMQGTFTKRMQEFRAQRDKVADYDRLMSDAEYARQVVLEAAPRLGLTVTTGNGNGNPATVKAPASGDRAPSELIDAVKGQLSPELAWMADSIANAHWAANKMTLAPLLQRQQQDTMRTRQAEYERLAADLSEVAPGWDEKESEMSELLAYLKSDDMNHPKFGSKLALLYNGVSGNEAAQVTATRRMVATARAKSSQSRTTGRTIDNLPERIRSAKTDQDAFRLAAEAAVEQLKRGAR